MHSVVAKAQLSPNVTRLDVAAPRIAQIRQPGQFVIVHRAEGAERIPLTIADSNPAAGAAACLQPPVQPPHTAIANANVRVPHRFIAQECANADRFSTPIGKQGTAIEKVVTGNGRIDWVRLAPMLMTFSNCFSASEDGALLPRRHHQAESRARD